MSPPIVARLTTAEGLALGRLVLESGSLRVEVADAAWKARIEAVALRPLRYFADADEPRVEKTVLKTVEPGTEKHLHVLLFELRPLGLEARLVPPGETP